MPRAYVSGPCKQSCLELWKSNSISLEERVPVRQLQYPRWAVAHLNFRFFARHSFAIANTLALHRAVAFSSSSVTKRPARCFCCSKASCGGGAWCFARWVLAVFGIMTRRSGQMKLVQVQERWYLESQLWTLAIDQYSILSKCCLVPFCASKSPCNILKWSLWQAWNVKEKLMPDSLKMLTCRSSKQFQVVEFEVVGTNKRAWFLCFSLVSVGLKT